MFRKFEYEGNYGKDITKFHNGLGGVFWSAKDVCRMLKINDADKAITEIDPEAKTETLYLPDEDESKNTEAKKLPRKVVVLDYRGLFALLFRSQAPIAKKFQSFVNEHLFFEMFLHWTPYFSEIYGEDCDNHYESLMEDLRVQLGVCG